jgi:hypothetical protein
MTWYKVSLRNDVKMQNKISSKPDRRFCTFRVVGARIRLARLALG